MFQKKSILAIVVLNLGYLRFGNKEIKKKLNIEDRGKVFSLYCRGFLERKKNGIKKPNCTRQQSILYEIRDTSIGKIWNYKISTSIKSSNLGLKTSIFSCFGKP